MGLSAKWLWGNGEHWWNRWRSPTKPQQSTRNYEQCCQRTCSKSIIDIFHENSCTFTSTGRHYEVKDNGEHVYTNPFSPLEVFQVEEGKNYYFRVISSAFTFPFSISIDGHPLHVVASDGFKFMTEVVDSLIITSGERYDFWIEATNPGRLSRFWLRAETLELQNSDSQVCILNRCHF